MSNRRTILSLLAMAVITAGCAGGGGDGQVSGEAVSLDRLDVEPTEIYAESNTRVTIGFTNTGNLPAKVDIGELGGNVLTNYCSDIFDIDSFEASSSNVSETKEEYYLDPEYRLQLNWNLEQSTGNVPLNGYSCNLQFEVPFDYSVEAFRQIQMTEDDETGGQVELYSQSSQGPMFLAIETIGSTSMQGAPIFLAEDNPEALIQLRNERPEQTSQRGTIRLTPPEVEGFDGVEFHDDGEPAECPQEEDIAETGGMLTLHDDQSQVFRCPFEVEMDSQSQRAEIFARADYTYIKNLPSRQVNVMYRGS